MTDAPSCGYDHVYVTVNKVRVNASSTAADADGGWTDITLQTPQKIDLLSLTNGVLSDLGSAPLPAGQYQQIRLVLAANQGNTLANSVVPTGGTEQPLSTPSATQSGYKIIQPFTVQANTLVDLVLDFNACKSIVTQGNGNYLLKPVVTATTAVVSGAITGFVAPGQTGATVYAEQNGVVIKGTVADSTGKFTLSPLVQSSTNGNYDVVIVDNNPAGGHATGVIRAVPVTASATTTVSTSTQPITLSASVTRTASGTATAAAQASLVALQTVGSASYEITSANADLTTGAYSMNLPAATPVAGTYSTTLPIALAPAGTAGAYTIQATSSTGAVQTAPANVAAGNQTGINFSF
ncbi:lipoprotein [Ralstonia sp. SET104]|nr:lipoprotein [Ralstonia sp. SET104]